MRVLKSNTVDVKWHSCVADFLSLFYPISCVNCASRIEGTILCANCVEDLHLWPEDKLLPNRLSSRAQIELLAPFCVYEKGGLAARLIHDFKYGGQLEIGRYLADIYADLLMRSNVAMRYDAILPVPMHWWRLARRGFNQSTEIAGVIATQLQLPILARSLIRKRYTKRQVGMDQEQRKANVQGKFALRSKAAIQGQRLLLIDDVLTTGSTALACADLLLKNGAASVGISALAIRA